MTTHPNEDYVKGPSFAGIAQLLEVHRAFHAMRVPKNRLKNRLYDITTYTGTQSASTKRPNAFLDKEMVGRLTRIVSGQLQRREAETDISYRIAAAAMAFLHYAKINVSFDFATYQQLIASRGNPAAENEIVNFRVANHLNPMDWARIASGEKNALDSATVSAVRQHFSYKLSSQGGISDSLGYWNMYYVFMLKLLTIYRNRRLSNVDKIKTFFDWQLRESLYSAICSMWALFLFSDKSNSKSFRKMDLAHAITLKQRLEDEVWDMLFLQQLKKYHTSSRDVWILCTINPDIAQIATCLLTTVDKEGTTGRFLSALYSPAEARTILASFLALEKKMTLPIDRAAQAKRFIAGLSKTKSDFEKTLALRQCN
ncbi:MAG: hypothetical protein JXR76_09900 [Deltaproteobacteria bacterium]|nr:hypothetical protein [Deltaproteobacteria bacterium]